MTTRMAVGLKNALLSAMLTSGSNSVTLLGAIDVYSSPMPATPETAATGTLLGTTTTLVASNVQQASLGTSVLSNPMAYTPTVTGTAAWARWKNASSTAAIDVDVTVSGGGGGIILSSLALTSGTPNSITAASIQFPALLGTVSLNVSLRNKMVDILFQGAANIGLGQSGSILLYSGAAPASADAPATGTLLATIPTGTTAWATPSGGSSALSTSLTAAATATGTVGYARIVKGPYAIQGSVGVGSGDFALDSLSTTSGTNISLVNATFSF